MKNKVKKSIDTRIRWYKEGKMTYGELEDFYYELMNVLYTNFKFELISDDVYTSCSSEIDAFLRFLLYERHEQAKQILK